MILLIDNFDSFTYNLFQQVGHLAAADRLSVEVKRNNEISSATLVNRKPRGIIFSPGPGGPADTGNSIEIFHHFRSTVPMLGVCLGHQMIAAELGAKVRRAHLPLHGKTSKVSHSGSGILKGLPQNFAVARYHSLSVAAETLPEELIPDGYSDDDELMAFHHSTQKIWGVQFHPESFLTSHGDAIIQNFLREVLN